MITYPPRYRPTSLSINMFAPECLGSYMRTLSVTSLASATNVQNLAWFYPFRLFETVTFVRAFVYNGATSNGNWDVGVYSDAGVRIASTGAIAQGTVSVVQDTALAVTLAPGRYYVAMSSSSATATFFTETVNAEAARLAGVTQASTAHVLPTNPTLAAFAQTIMPHFGLMRRSLVQ